MTLYGPRPSHLPGNGYWVAEQMICNRCQHPWIAVHPASEWLQCPKCSAMTQSAPTTGGCYAPHRSIRTGRWR